MFHLLSLFLLFISSNFILVNAEYSLFATSLVTCMDNSKVYASSFDFELKPNDRSLHYDLKMTSEIDDYILAIVEVYAYGFKIISEEIDLCNIGWKQFCPLHSGDVEMDSIEYLPQHYINMIPTIAYYVPDLDASARLKVFNNQSEYLGCVDLFVSNGKTVSQLGIKWAVAIIAGLGLLLSASLSTFGNSIAASHISAISMSLFLYFQSVALVSMEHVRHIPPIAEAWAENMAWSIGLIRIHFMQKIFRWFIESTGGTASLNLTSTITSILIQKHRKRFFQLSNYIKRNTKDLLKYDSFLTRRNFGDILYGNENTFIYRGIRRFGYAMKIENTSIVVTSFTFFILCGYVLAGFIIVMKLVFELLMKSNVISKNSKYFNPTSFTKNWKPILKGALLRFIYVGFAQLMVFSFWEFIQRDSAAVIVIACFFIVMCAGLMLWSAYRTCYFAKKSIELHNNPAALLYGDNQILNKYGFFYTMFNANHYWWNIILLSYMTLKCLFIGFSQASGQTQSLVVWLADFFYWIAIIYFQPYLDKPTNVINIFIATVNWLNSFMFLFFSGLFDQVYASAAIMGWVFFILNAFVTNVLIFLILGFTIMMIFSKNPDLRFRPAKDDRYSFQEKNKLSSDLDNNDELFALGEVAKDHNDNWEDEYYSTNNKKNIFASSDDDLFTEKNEDTATSSSTTNDDSRLNLSFSDRLLNKFQSKRTNTNNSDDNLKKDNVIVTESTRDSTMTDYYHESEDTSMILNNSSNTNINIPQNNITNNNNDNFI